MAYNDETKANLYAEKFKEDDMGKITLGRTGIKSDKNGFGVLPLQRVSKETACHILRKAYQNGVTFFDTARSYSDSEEKIGMALAAVRNSITIATKTPAKTVADFWQDLETSLKLLKTDYIDIYQFHNIEFCPRPSDGTGLYEAMLEARAQGKIRYIGITNHRMHIAEEAIASGLYDTLQFPLSYLSSERDLSLIQLCKAGNIGLIAMKALSGGLLTNSAAAYAWMDQYEQLLPIWGIQKEEELDEFIAYMKNPPLMNEKISGIIEQDRAQLSGNFCRGCGYCMPCPVGIEINNCARMSQLIRRSPSAQWLEPTEQEKMAKIEHCIECRQCSSKCPYGLDTPALLKQHLKDYQDIVAGKTIVC